MNKFDVVVVGAGPGGYPAAIRAAQLGRKVALVEREALGGTCLNWGCIPTKSLIASSTLVHQCREGAALGVDVNKMSFDYGRMVARKNEIVQRLTGGVGQLLKANGVQLFNGTARLEGERRLSVHAGQDDVAWLEADAIILASGSVSAMPGFLPRHPRILESRAFLDLDALPETLIVLGGGVIGCEFACMAAQLGVKVQVVEMLDDILPMIDRDVRRVLRRSMEELGIRILTGAPLERIEADDQGVRGRFHDEPVAGDLLLAAVGRRANTEALDLARAGLSTDKGGQLAVDASGRTACPSIFAIGDIVQGSTQLAHAATAQGLVAAEAAAGKPSRNEKTVPACIFTAPEIGVVGLTESQAEAEKHAIRVGTFSFATLGKAMASGDTTGFVKLIADETTGQLLGAQAIGGHATELIAEAALAIRNELTETELAHTIHSHPTLSEAWMEAAHALQGVCIHAAPRKRKSRGA